MTNQGERLARIETILEQSVALRLDELARDVKAIRRDLDTDKADLAALKNRGSGILIGVAIAAGSLGASMTTLWRWLVDLVN